jgi:hypothetical protein
MEEFREMNQGRGGNGTTSVFGNQLVHMKLIIISFVCLFYRAWWIATRLQREYVSKIILKGCEITENKSKDPALIVCLWTP